MVYLSIQDPRPDGLCHATLALKDGHGRLVVASHAKGVEIVTRLFNDASEVPPTLKEFAKIAKEAGYAPEDRAGDVDPLIALYDKEEEAEDAPEEAKPRRRK